jgi:mono/diheme cytochrome c family protein
MKCFGSLIPAIGAVLLLTAPLVTAQTKAKENPGFSGSDLFREHCASCHGLDGHGHGPATEALKTPPTDLTMMVKQNNGKFDPKYVRRVIQGDKSVAAHGSREMPSWGTAFKSAAVNQAGVDARINALVDYLQTIQR